jgi:hypothetical protein
MPAERRFHLVGEEARRTIAEDVYCRVLDAESALEPML